MRGRGVSEKVKGSAILDDNLQIQSNRLLIKKRRDVKRVKAHRGLCD